MKNCAFFFIAIVNVFSFGCFAQRGERIPANSEKGNTAVLPNDLSNNEDYVVVSYHVVEKVRGNITTYDVSNLSLIDKNDLGPNNSRVVTPKYGKAKHKATTLELPKVSFDPVINTEKKLTKPEVIETAVAPVKKLDFIMVDIMSTYERILDKGGYESIEMLKKVANNRYFKGDLVVSYKWYSQLFALTLDLDIVYYYRYAQALKAVGQIPKANAMMKVFESKKILK